MNLRVVGAGLGRTGTNSLKIALAQLLGGPCYHMIDVNERPGDDDVWRRAALGEAVDWEALLDPFAAVVDWPACSFWRELSALNPDAPILLSTRDTSDLWWRSADSTIFQSILQSRAERTTSHESMIETILERHFTPHIDDREASIEAYERHNADVRASVEPGKLIDWRPGDGWGPLCDGLGLPVPDEPFPHANTSADFRARRGWDGSAT